MRKITAKINEQDWDLFETMVNDVGLRRDAYLCKVLPTELEFIARQPWSNDDAGQKYLANIRRTAAKHSTQVTLRIDDHVAGQIDEICLTKKLPRDALLDAIISFLLIRVLPHALVLNMPRASLKFKTEADLRRHVANRHPQYSDIFHSRKDVQDPDFYEWKLHYTEEKIEEIERVLNEFMSRTSKTPNQGKSSVGGK